MTTGNFMGADIWLDNADANVRVTTNHGDLEILFNQLGLDPVISDCGGLERQLR